MFGLDSYRSGREEDEGYVIIKLPFLLLKRCRRRQQIKKNKIVSRRKISAPIPIEE